MRSIKIGRKFSFVYLGFNLKQEVGLVVVVVRKFLLLGFWEFSWFDIGFSVFCFWFCSICSRQRVVGISRFIVIGGFIGWVQFRIFFGRDRLRCLGYVQNFFRSRTGDRRYCFFVGEMERGIVFVVFFSFFWVLLCFLIYSLFYFGIGDITFILQVEIIINVY